MPVQDNQVQANNNCDIYANLPTIAKLGKSICEPSTQKNKPLYIFTRAGHSSHFGQDLWCTHVARNIAIAVYSSLCTLPTIQMYTGIFVYSVSSHLEWGLLAFSNFDQWDPSKNQTVCHFCRVCQSTHFARSRYAILYSSLCTLVHGQTCRWLTLDKPVGGLRVPEYWPMGAEPK